MFGLAHNYKPNRSYKKIYISNNYSNTMEKKSIIGIISIILSVLSWGASFSFGSCYVNEAGKKLCMGGAALKDLWYTYWLVALILLGFGIWILTKKNK